MKLFFIRHGQTDANLNGIYSGQADVMLTELGRSQAQGLEPVLRQFTFDRVYSSDLTRAIHTQQLALPGVESIPTPLLREYNIGSITGKPIRAVREQFGNLNSDFTAFGGEDSAAMDARVCSFLSLLEADPCEYAVAFSHNGTIKSMLRLVLGESCKTVNMINRNCSISVFEFTGKQWQLLAWNYMGAL